MPRKTVSKPAKTKAAKDKFDFSAAYAELEEIVEWFEQESPDLDEALKRFERGLELAQECQNKLKRVENRVTEIKARFDD